MEPEKTLVEASNKQDREQMALILFRNGYTVREKKRKEGSKTIVYVEYWK